MAYKSKGSVNVSYFCDLADNNSIVLNPVRLDDTRSVYSQRSFSQWARTPEFSTVPFTKISSTADVGPSSYSKLHPDLNSSRTSRFRESSRHSGIHNSNKNGRQETLHNTRPAVVMTPPETSNDAISGHSHRSCNEPETVSLSHRERSVHGDDKYKGYKVKNKKS